MATRRRLLANLAAGGVLSMAGCASVVDQTPSDQGSAGAEATQTTANPTETTTTTAEEATQDEPTETQTTEGWSIDDVSIEAPSETYADVSIPSESSDFPRMGPDDAPVVTVLGNWKCPYTRDFVLGQFPAIVDEYVRSGDLAFEFRSLAYLGGEPFLGPDAPEATRGGLGVWETDPDAFWTYFATVFANQPQERREWGHPELLTRFAQEAGVDDPERVGSAVTEGAFEGRLEATVEYADSVDVTTVPRVIVDDTVTAPTVDPDETREQLEWASDR